jgi:8-oxo-dGTP diphosphatase
MGVFVVILFFILALVISVLQGESHERKITDQIESMGGRVISIEKKHFSIGPFMVVGKGRTVYRIEYRVGLTQRDYNKPNYPGLFESGAGGSILKGETFLEGAIRELREETGIDCKDLKLIYTITTDDTIYKGYLCVVSVDKNSIVLQDGETIAYKWINKKEFLDFYKGDQFIPVLGNRLSNFIENYIKE